MIDSTEIVRIALKNLIFVGDGVLPKHMVDQVLFGDTGLPRSLESSLLAYISSRSKLDLVNFSIKVIDDFYISSIDPNLHLATVCVLYSDSALKLKDAIYKLNIHPSVSLLSSEALALIEIAAAILEEEEMGIRAVDDDKLLSDSMKNYINSYRAAGT